MRPAVEAYWTVQRRYGSGQSRGGGELWAQECGVGTRFAGVPALHDSRNTRCQQHRRGDPSRISTPWQDGKASRDVNWTQLASPTVAHRRPHASFLTPLTEGQGRASTSDAVVTALVHLDAEHVVAARPGGRRSLEPSVVAARGEVKNAADGTSGDHPRADQVEKLPLLLRRALLALPGHREFLLPRT